MPGPVVPTPDSFFEQFPDAPREPLYGTMDIRRYIDPITGEQTTGSSTDIGYRQKLKEYLDANPAAAEAYANRPQASPFKQPKLDPDTGAIVKRGAGETPPSEEEPPPPSEEEGPPPPEEEDPTVSPPRS